MFLCFQIDNSDGLHRRVSLSEESGHQRGKGWSSKGNRSIQRPKVRSNSNQFITMLVALRMGRKDLTFP